MRATFLVRQQLSPAGLGQCQRGKNDDRVRDRSENADRAAERNRSRQQADQRRKKRADPATKIVAEASARAAHAGWKQFGEHWTHTTEYPGREEAERESQDQYEPV